MAYGIQIANTYGTTIIDDTTSSLQVIAEGFAYTNVFVPYPPTNGINVPLILISPPTGIGVRYFDNYNNTGIKENNFIIGCDSSALFEYKVLVPRDYLGASTGGMGLQIYNNSGIPKFDTNNLKALNLNTVLVTDTNNRTVPFTNTGKKPFFSTNIITYYSSMYSSNGYDTVYCTYATLNSNSSLSLSPRQTAYRYNPYGFFSNWNYESQPIQIIIGDFKHL
jgi:hypothetical protein